MSFKKKDRQTHKLYSSIVEKSNQDKIEIQPELKVKGPSLFSKMRVKFNKGLLKFGCMKSRAKTPKRKKRKISSDIESEFEYKPPPKPPKNIAEI